MQPEIFVAVCGLFVVGLLYAESGEHNRLRRVLKPAASVAFIGAGAAAGALDTRFGQAILAGLVLCAFGDILLIPKSAKTFLAGMAAFAAGHAAYIAAFMIGGTLFGVSAVAAAAGGVALSVSLLVMLWRDLGAFRGPVIGYSVIISLMLTASAAHWAASPSIQNLYLVLAASAFAVSDISVALDRFKGADFSNRLWGLPLYYAAQCLFAVNV